MDSSILRWRTIPTTPFRFSLASATELSRRKVCFRLGNGPTSLAVADFNVDGRLDIIAADQTDNAISVLLNLGSGLFGPNFELPVGTTPVGVASADFDANGRPDAVLADKGSNTATMILNNTNFTGATNPLAATAFPGVEYLDIGTKVKATARIHPNDEVTSPPQSRDQQPRSSDRESNT